MLSGICGQANIPVSLSFHTQWTCLQFDAALAIAAHPRRHSLHSQQTYKRCVYYTRSSHHPYAGTQRQDPVAVADTAIAVQIEKQRVAEALAARDNVIDRLKYACTSVQQKEATILRLQRELEALRRSSTPRILTPSASPGADIRLCSEFADLSSPALSLVEPANKTIAARQAILAALPLPSDIPEDSIEPIVLPASCTLHDFLRNTTGSLKDALKNYRVLAQPTTYWCPEREEHGYLLTPVFKCSTNPRVITAHRWVAVDVIGHMKEPTECFYNRDGKWYYAGIYRAFRMDDLTTQEWASLSTETTQALVKETLAARKNVSPQNHYETSQLYAVGALRVACIGLQCVGFSDVVYHGVLEQARYVQWAQSAGRQVALPTARQDTPSDDVKPAAN
ncbi:hypothetical protein SCLCIDRAFT_116701 [Scleroderma citrinum Foug A]|uniref:DUF6697 domain-containing protein n=1 Tax=Scleroderma citrinum Foug A TaxID=1036808 RepID=A0A0C3AFP0_9AGAM|nr:hypothetical protein SCLCIDRAFT_116701 [Scleroderma citrinum Foug A]